MLKIILPIFFLICQNLYSENIFLGINGLAKVGKECFLSVSLKNDSKMRLKYLEAIIFASDRQINSIGKSKIILDNLKNHQTYLTSKKIFKNEALLCPQIEIIEAHINKCVLSDSSSKNLCNKLLKVTSVTSNNQIKVANKLENIAFYEEKNEKDFLIPELNIILKPLNISLAKKYNIKKRRSGMVVINNKDGIIFKEGDLITEMEMNEIHFINQVDMKIKEILNKDKNLILVNLIRNNKEKIIAAKIIK